MTEMRLINAPKLFYTYKFDYNNSNDERIEHPNDAPLQTV